MPSIMYFKRKTCVIVLLLFTVNSQCAKILGFFNMASVSHQIVFQPIWKELSLRGHQIVVATPNPLKDPTLVNLTEIDLSFLYNHLGNIQQDLSQGMDHWKLTSTFTQFLENNTERIFANSDVMNLVKDNETTFDLVITEALFPTPAAFAVKYNCPLVAVASFTVTNHLHQVIGTATHPVLYPDFATRYDDDITFLEKVDAVLFDIWYKYLYSYDILPALDSIIKRIFGNDMPDLIELEKNISVLLLNTNPILHKPRPYGPNVVEMGGRMHIKPKKPLPEVRFLFICCL